MQDPVNVVYDSACDILEACRRFRSELSRPHTDDALAATFGCLEEAMNVLVDANADLHERIRQRRDIEPEHAIPLAVALMSLTLSFDEVKGDLAAARRAAARRSRGRSARSPGPLRAAHRQRHG